VASPKGVPQPGSQQLLGSGRAFDDREPTASLGGLTSKGSASPGDPKADTVTQPMIILVRSAFPPKVDKYVKDFAGTRFPKQYDKEMSLIQNIMLKCVSPLTLAWKDLLEEGVLEQPELQVSAPAVL